MATDADNPAARRQWFIVGRWQEFEGEGRANLLRVIAVAAFYINHLINYQFFNEGPNAVNETFHIAVTALAVAWTMVSLGVLLCLRRQFFPAALKYVSTACDVALLTAMIMIAGGPQSPLTAGYFLIIAVSALRFRLPLIWFATLGSLAAYLYLVGAQEWKEGSSWFDERHVVPVVEQIIMLISLGLSGVIVGQVIRRVRTLAADYAARLQAAEGKKAES